jgi:hypothetical protein
MSSVATTPPPSLGQRIWTRQLLVALAVGLVCAALAAILSARSMRTGDIDQVIFASRAMWEGRNPYTLIGPGLEFDWPWPLYYPLTGAVLLSPLAWLPVLAARTVFVFLSVALLTFAVMRHGSSRWPLFASTPFFYALLAAQWSMVLTAAFVLPWLTLVFVAKPNLAAAYFLSAPSRRGVLVALGATIVTLTISLVLVPGWPADWIAAVRSAPAFTAPVMHRGGPLLLLALMRWRQPEARLLLAMSVVPHNMVLYEALVLFLVPRTFRQSVLLAALSSVAVVFIILFVPMQPESAAGNYYQGDVMVALTYLPCLAMILRRPNQPDQTPLPDASMAAADPAHPA